MRNPPNVQQSAVVFDFGTSPHGLSANLHETGFSFDDGGSGRHEEKLTAPASEYPLACKPSTRLDTSAKVPSFAVHGASHAQQDEFSTSPADLIPATPQAAPKCAGGKPQAYTCAEVREACRRLKAASKSASHNGMHHLSITEVEFLHLHSAVERTRNKTRKAIGKGLCEIGDLRASDSLWEKLQDVMYARIYGRKA